MRAVVQEAYGPPAVLQVREVPTPAIVDDEVLVRVRAVALHPDVWHVMRGWPLVLRLMGAGVRRPKDRIPGTDMAGRVISVGARVTRLHPGDDVFGETIRGVQWRNGGSLAECVAAPANQLARIPANVTYEQAAAVPTTGLIVLSNLRAETRPLPGQRVLVNGAGGGAGSIAVQVCRAAGADVTGVDVRDKLDLVSSFGANRVIDGERVDFTEGSDRYDLIVDIPGNRRFAACRRVLAPTGHYVLIGHDGFGRRGRRILGSVPRVLSLVALSPFVRQLPRAAFSTPDKGAMMDELAALLASGELRPVIDSSFPLSEIRAAMSHLANDVTRGKVVVVP